MIANRGGRLPVRLLSVLTPRPLLHGLVFLRRCLARGSRWIRWALVSRWTLYGSCHGDEETGYAVLGYFCITLRLLLRGLGRAI